MVLGDGGHAHSVAEAAETAGFAVIQLYPIDENDDRFGRLLSGLSTLDMSSVGLALGIGANYARRFLHEAVMARYPNAAFPVIVHAKAWTSPSARIGDGSVILSHASIGAAASTGLGAILNAGSSLDHDSKLGSFASLGPGARTGGSVSIGKRTMVGIQAGVLQGRSIGADTVVGAHSLVIADVPSLSVAFGQPCRLIRSREANERYL